MANEQERARATRHRRLMALVRIYGVAADAGEPGDLAIVADIIAETYASLDIPAAAEHWGATRDAVIDRIIGEEATA